MLRQLLMRRSLAPGLTRTPARPGADAARLAKIVLGVALCALLGGVALFGGQISRIVTNQGQIVIETDGAGIELVIKDQEGKVLVDGETQREITFKAGEYNIEVTVKDSAGEQRFVTDHFTLSRNGKKIVDARWQVAKAVIGSRTRESSDRSLTTSATGATSATATTSATADSDRRAAEYLLSIYGRITIRENGHERPIGRVDELPRGAFELTAAHLDSKPQVTDAGLAHFQGCQNLTTLDLQRNKLSDAGLVHLKQCNNITFLSLSNVRMSDASLDDLAGMSRLQHLDLGNTRMSLLGHEKLKAALPGLKFQWSEPNRSVALFVLALGGSVEISQRDEMESHPIKAAADLPRDLFQVRRVSLAGVDKPIDKLLPQFAALRFPEFDRLESLDLSGTTGWNVPQTNMDFLAGIHGLRELIFADAGLSGGSLAKLPKMPALKRLVLADNDFRRSGRGLSRLSDFTQLESLDLRRTNISVTSIAELKATLPNCQIAHDTAEK